MSARKSFSSSTIVGDTNTAREPSALREAVPMSLIVLLRVLAYSKSTSETFEIPAVETLATSIDLLHAGEAKGDSDRGRGRGRQVIKDDET